MTAKDTEVPPTGRREGEDRRKQQVAIAYPDRRKGKRRCGEDRRAHPRD